jgi:hypothetical protein
MSTQTRTLIWPRQSTFRDGAESYGPGEHEVPEEKREQYLDRGWIDAEQTDTDAATVDDTADPSEDETDTSDLDESDTSGTDVHPADESEAKAASDDNHGAKGSSVGAEQFVGERTVSELEAVLESGDHDDSDRLEALLDAEQAGKDRTGAKDAIRDRMD